MTDFGSLKILGVSVAGAHQVRPYKPREIRLRPDFFTNPPADARLPLFDRV